MPITYTRNIHKLLPISLLKPETDGQHRGLQSVYHPYKRICKINMPETRVPRRDTDYEDLISQRLSQTKFGRQNVDVLQE